MTERQNIEWKQSWQDDYLKWVCGFANLPCRQAGAVGGVIYIGKDDEGRVVGLADYQSLLEIFLWNKGKSRVESIIGKH